MGIKLIKKTEILFFLILYILLTVYLHHSEFMVFLTNDGDINYFQNSVLIAFYCVAYIYLIRNININFQFCFVRFKSFCHFLFFVFKPVSLILASYLLSIVGIGLLFAFLSRNRIELSGVIFFAIGMVFLLAFITLFYLITSYKFNAVFGIASTFIGTVFGCLLSFGNVLDTYSIFKIPTFNVNYIPYIVNILLGIVFPYVIIVIIYCIPTKREKV